MKLQEPVELDHHIQAACLPFGFSADFPTVFAKTANITDVFAVGWGQTDPVERITANRLKNVKLRLYAFEYCSASSSYTNRFTQICAGDLVNNFDTCLGDSGGALYMYVNVNGKRKPLAVGIASYGLGCATPNTPA